MSFSKIGDYTAIAAIQAGNGIGGGEKAGVKNEQLQAAFSNQMDMAQSLFGEGSERDGGGSSSGSFDVSLLNDSMMFEALATISRLMRTEAGLPQRTVTPQAGAAKMQQNAFAPQVAVDVGSLSAQFESGGAGVAAIGYDRVGGTSYGKYQIASQPGTMDRFLKFLDEKAPAWANRLREAGPANTGSKEGGMPTAWKSIASENGQLFEKLQHEFIGKETYDPARSMILKQTGLDFDNAPPALREVLWSTSVQHGPTGAANIFNKVIDMFVSGNKTGDFNSKLIEGVYDTRKGQFGSSTKRVQQSVVSRLNSEKQIGRAHV